MDLTLWEWMIARYWIHMILVILCLVWALIGSEYVSYEPRYIDLKWDNKDLVICFERSDFVSRSIEDEMFYRGIGRTLIQLEAIRKPTSPLWKSLDSLLDQWEQNLNDTD